jgi:molybdopterin converting factor subunit 1
MAAADVQVNLLFFAKSRELVGEKQVLLSVSQGLTARAVLNHILQAYPSLEVIADNLLLAHNQEYLDLQDLQSLHFQPGDELAIIPPISGG